MKVLTLLSGGIDSTTLLYSLLKQENEVISLSFDYGQKHAVRELCSVYMITDQVRKIYKNFLSHYHICLSNTIGSGSLIDVKQQIPKGHYTDESMKSTFVPYRNLILLSIGMSYAVKIGAKEVYYGAHSGDHAIYPDCREKFVEQLNIISHISSYENQAVFISAPFITWTKTDIVKHGLEIGVDYNRTYSCYNGGKRPCLECGTCQERTIAFRDANAIDPYLLPEEWDKALKIVEGKK